MIIEAEGTVIPGVNCRTGRRREHGVTSLHWGGKRHRKLGSKDYGTLGDIHNDALSCLDKKMNDSKKAFESKTKYQEPNKSVENIKK